MLGIFGFIFIIVAPFIIYRNAKQNGHKPLFWAILAFAVGFGLQIVLPLIIGTVIAIVMTIQGASEIEVQEALETPAIIIGIITLVLSVGCVMWIMSRVNRIAEETPFSPPPPPSEYN